jgi:hypothetical protein
MRHTGNRRSNGRDRTLKYDVCRLVHNTGLRIAEAASIQPTAGKMQRCPVLAIANQPQV